jgi:hypothetical protein
MSIDRDTFENTSEDELADLSVTDQVLGFLAAKLEGYSGYERATALFNDQLGAEDTESWREHAPSGSHPSVEDDQ